jgi:hypothetical protein
MSLRAEKRCRKYELEKKGRKGGEQSRMQTGNNKRMKMRASFPFLIKTKVSKNKRSESAPLPFRRKNVPNFFVARKQVPRVRCKKYYVWKCITVKKRKRYKEGWFLRLEVRGIAIGQSSADDPCSVSFLFF